MTRADQSKDKSLYSDTLSTLSEIVVSGLRNYFPGLNLFLESLCEARYGCSLKELIARDIGEFCRLLDNHFSSRETTFRILRLVLKPVLRGSEGEEALDELLRGNPDPLLRCVDEVRKKGKRTT